MKTSHYWIGHFKQSALQQRINWDLQPNLTATEQANILASLRTWQLAETSEGRQLIAAATRYADKFDDPGYLEAIKLFIKRNKNTARTWANMSTALASSAKRKAGTIRSSVLPATLPPVWRYGR
ncbi:hypothetical protein [Mucilaginibacter myungsuensis]|uniref:hypothetical protein n=1 Tax=Mucilaginibacter myungsuensis TaxID=649104 RepID=UPI001D16105A|nr:hypothetical protein [Mucilaginibacter myungsuensis]MDN3599342.1 hypothetical protein [Mucilaginibacter myungsuensis]